MSRNIVKKMFLQPFKNVKVIISSCIIPKQVVGLTWDILTKWGRRETWRGCSPFSFPLQKWVWIFLLPVHRKHVFLAHLSPDMPIPIGNALFEKDMFVH